MPVEIGLTLFDDFILYYEHSKCIAFSRYCTHLGCKVKKNGEQGLICPCHGSSFSNEGLVLQGPASQALPRYKCEIDSKQQRIIVVIDTE